MNISINYNRVAIKLEDKTVQFVVWDLRKSQHEDLQHQLKTAFLLCQNFFEIARHLQINGFDAHLEDIY